MLHALAALRNQCQPGVLGTTLATDHLNSSKNDTHNPDNSKMRLAPGTLIVVARNEQELKARLPRATNCPIHVIIPDRVTDIAPDAFSHCSVISSVEISCSVSRIGPRAFMSCSMLTAVTIPNGVVTIGSSAFRKCAKLSTVILPGSLTEIGAQAFAESALASVIIPPKVSSIGELAFHKSALTSLEFDGDHDALEIGTRAFLECDKLGNVALPRGVSVLTRELFCHCSSLTAVTVPDGVTTIGSRAFAYCRELRSAVLPDTVTTIEEGAFESCGHLDMHLPPSIVSLGPEAFMRCSRLSTAIIPQSVTAIPSSLFQFCVNLIKVHIPSGVTTIGDSAFRGCDQLGSVTIPDGVTTIGNAAFGGCTRLAVARIPSSVQKLGGGKEYWHSNGVFDYCPKLCFVIGPAELYSADDMHFKGCTNLRAFVADTEKNQRHALKLKFWNKESHKIGWPSDRQWAVAIFMVAARLRADGTPLPPLPNEMWLAIMECVPRWAIGRRARFFS